MTHWIASLPYPHPSSVTFGGNLHPCDGVDYRWEKILNAIVSGQGMTYQAAAEHVIGLPIYGGALPEHELAAIRSTAAALAGGVTAESAEKR